MADLALGFRGLPPATLGKDYFFTLSAVGGVPPYAFSVSALPSNLVESRGAIAGIPTVSGTFRVGVSVLDAEESAAQGFFPLEVIERNPKPPPPRELTDAEAETELVKISRDVNAMRPEAILAAIYREIRDMNQNLTAILQQLSGG